MDKWSVEFCEEFDQEFAGFSRGLKTAIALRLKLLAVGGPSLGRPIVDTLNGSKHANMKELRLSFDGCPWRLAFAFDPNRKAIVLVAANKSGVPQRKFYKTLIKTADQRLDNYLRNSGE
ncbi:MAG: addiction module toxin RelE [Spirulina sp. SIO3F2]|nr:addiction module toxin RelE [Spirulina sp. SIO3F2]